VTRFAALAPSNSYGANMVQALAAATAELGATVTRVEYYDPAGDPGPAIKRIADYERRAAELQAQRAELRERGDDLARQALRRLENRDTVGDVEFEALLLPAAGEELQKLAALLPYYDIDPARVRMLGTWQWDQDGIGAEPALVGGWFAGPPRDQRLTFETEFRALYKRRPHRLASLAYDATALVAVLASQAGPIADRRQAFSRARLTSANGFAGVDGIFRLLPTGETERGLAVIQVERAGFRVLSPAPQSFQAALN
jgi:ABC-type branched-subunit amino acid transport system substrate-binding protein